MPIAETIAAAASSLVPALAAAGGLVSGSKFVQEGQRGVKLRFGKVVRTRDGHTRVIRPGFCFVIPAIEQLRRTHVRTRTYNLPTQEVMLADGTVFAVSAAVMCNVRDTPADVYNVLFEVDNLSRAISDYVSAELRRIVAGRTYRDMSDRDAVAFAVTAVVAAQLNAWGVELHQVMLTDCSPTPETADMILIGSQVAIRRQALTDAAEVLAGDKNVAALHPTVAAALIGVPVATALGSSHTTDSIDPDAQ